MSKSSDNQPVEVRLRDDWAERYSRSTPEDVDLWLTTNERIQAAGERETEASLRKWTAIGLWVAGVIVLGVSLSLIVSQAFEWSKLPDMAVTALVGSVAAEFVGMFYVVVRYLFSQGTGTQKE